MSLYDMKFTAAQVSEITGVSANNLQNWVKRKLIIGQNTFDGGGSQGRHRQFNLYALMQLALTEDLARAGLETSIAAKAAASFSHVGGGGEVFDLPERNPGFPFHQRFGETIFGVGPDGRTFEELWESTKGPGEARRDTYGNLRQALGNTFMTVNASEIFNRVCGGIGVVMRSRDFHPYKVLDEAYPEAVEG